MTDDELKSGFTRRDLVRGTLVGAIAVGAGDEGRGGRDGPRRAGAGSAGAEGQRSGPPALGRAPRHARRRAARSDRADGHEGPSAVEAPAAPVPSSSTARPSAPASRSPTRSRGARSPRSKAWRRTAASPLSSRPSSRPTPSSAASAPPGWSCPARCSWTRTRSPAATEIREAVAGNLCRCGTYPHVFDAVERVAGVQKAGTDSGLPPTHARLPTLDPRLFSDDMRVASATLEVMDAEEA